MTLPIRVRLTLWYVFMLAVTLLLFAAGLYAFVAHEEKQSTEAMLCERAGSFERAYAGEAREESGEAAVIEVAKDFVAGDGTVFIYRPPAGGPNDRGRIANRGGKPFPSHRRLASFRRAGAAGHSSQRVARTAGAVVSTTETIAGRYVARIAHADHDCTQRGRGHFVA